MFSQLKSKIKMLKIDKYLVILILLLVVCYAVGFYTSGAYDLRRTFNNKIVMGTALVARNTVNGDYFITKLILPVSYAFFPNVENHPDFIRPSFQVFLYSLLFLLGSPGALVIKMLNAFLFVLNGCLVYWLILRMAKLGLISNVQRINPKFQIIAALTAICSSVFFVDYFRMALQDYYEIITYTLMLITMHVILASKRKPFVLGMLFSMMYLSKPNMILFAIVYTFYILMFRTKPKIDDWLRTGLVIIFGFLIIQIPIMVRSYIYTGDILFSIQKHVDTIKGIVSSHNQLYKSFELPPSTIDVIWNNLPQFILQWKNRVLTVFTYLFSIDKIFFWIGTLLFIRNNRNSRRLINSYLCFLVLHILLMAFVLESRDTVRTYRYIYSFIVVFSLLEFFTLGSKLFLKNSQRLQYMFLLLMVISLPISTFFVADSLGGVNSVRNIPNSIAEDIRNLGIDCLYSNSPYEASWFLDIPTIYPPIDNLDMLQSGPEECNHYFYLDKEDKELEEFLEENGFLVYQNLGYYVYEFYP